MKYIDWADFEKIDIRVGTIVSAELLEKARKPAFKLNIDFGPLGIKKSSAQITHFYSPDTLINKQIVAVLNFRPKQIGSFMSECLVLGIYDSENNVVLLKPDKQTENGFKIG